MLKEIKSWKKQNRSYTLACFLKKCGKNVTAINAGEHATRIEDGVS